MNRVPELILEHAAELRKNPTRVESLMRDFIPLLNKLYGLKIVAQQPIELLPGEWAILDWYEWHSFTCAEFDGSGHSDPIQKDRDHRRDELLRMGIPSIITIRFSNAEVLENVIGTAHEIAHICLQRISQGYLLLPLDQFELAVEHDIWERLGLPAPL